MKECSIAKMNPQIIFNQMLRAGGNRIYCAFVRLKEKWRILNRPLDISLGFSSYLIYACFVPHKFCEDHHFYVYKILFMIRYTCHLPDQCCLHHAITDKLYSFNTSSGCHVCDAIISEYFGEYLQYYFEKKIKKKKKNFSQFSLF